MRGKERDDLEGSEASGIVETLENLGNAVLRLRNEALDCGDGLVRAAGQELNLGGTLVTNLVSAGVMLDPARTTHRAVGEGNGTSELNQVASADRMKGQEVEEVVDTVGDTVVGLEERLNSREKKHRAVSSTATVKDDVNFLSIDTAEKNIRLGALATRNRNGIV